MGCAWRQNLASMSRQDWSSFVKQPAGCAKADERHILITYFGDSAVAHDAHKTAQHKHEDEKLSISFFGNRKIY